MKQLVVDASVAVKWLLPEEHSSAAARLLEEDYELWAPDLIWAEAGNVFWKKWRRGEVQAEERACPLVTADRKLYNAPAGGPSRVPLLWVAGIA